MLEHIISNKCISWEEMSIKFGIGLAGLCDNCPRGRNLKNREGVFLKLAWATDKELDRMGVAGLGLLTYDC
jgi:hypothetical protein